MSSKLQAMKKGGKVLSEAMASAINSAKPGVKLPQIEDIFCQQLKKNSVEASFKKVANYSWATCINIDNGVVHGIPEGKSISKGDLLSIDGGVFCDGFHTDMA